MRHEAGWPLFSGALAVLVAVRAFWFDFWSIIRFGLFLLISRSIGFGAGFDL